MEADLSNFSLGQPESRGKAHAHRMNLLVPLLVSYKLQMKKNRQTVTFSTYTKENLRKRKIREDQNATFAIRRTRASHASLIHSLHVHFALTLVVTKLVIMAVIEKGKDRK